MFGNITLLEVINLVTVTLGFSTTVHLTYSYLSLYHYTPNPAVLHVFPTQIFQKTFPLISNVSEAFFNTFFFTQIHKSGTLSIGCILNHLFMHSCVFVFSRKKTHEWEIGYVFRFCICKSPFLFRFLFWAWNLEKMKENLNNHESKFSIILSYWARSFYSVGTVRKASRNFKICNFIISVLAEEQRKRRGILFSWKEYALYPSKYLEK